MNATKTQQKTKLKNVDDITLNELVSLAYHGCSPVGKVSEITHFLRKEFKVDVSDDDIYRILSNDICDTEAQMLYELYGY
jgi:hypothetical protein